MSLTLNPLILGMKKARAANAKLWQFPTGLVNYLNTRLPEFDPQPEALHIDQMLPTHYERCGIQTLAVQGADPWWDSEGSSKFQYGTTDQVRS
jgi:hypothetical protein